ncbi:MAG: dihydrofolate reductase family protein [Acidimicrobiales bacterium]
MASVRVHCLSVSLDGYASGEGQGRDAPFGHAGGRLLAWFDATRSFRELHGLTGGATNADDGFASRWTPRVGADIMGRNMFGPERGPWGESDWKGWWGDNPPYHNPVFVLTHHPHPSIEMEGGTTFHFIDASPADALAVAREAAGELDVRVGGGPSTVRQFLSADLVDYLHVAVVPIVLGRGEPLWEGLEGLEDRFTIESVTTPSGVTHLVCNRR